jgi:hypothetical protein
MIVSPKINRVMPALFVAALHDADTNCLTTSDNYTGVQLAWAILRRTLLDFA